MANFLSKEGVTDSYLRAMRRAQRGLQLWFPLLLSTINGTERQVNPFLGLHAADIYRKREFAKRKRANAVRIMECYGYAGDGEDELGPIAPVECAVLDSFGDVLDGDGWRGFEVGDGAGDFEDAIMGAGGEALLLHSAF